MAWLQGQWQRRRVSGQPTGNLFATMGKGLPDVLIANSGAHAFHLPGVEPIDLPPAQAVRDYAANLTKACS